MHGMEIKLADRVTQIKPSPTLAVNAKAKALRAAGADILNFSVGEPDFDTPPHVCDAAKKAIDERFTRYTPVPGIPELRQAVVDRLMADHGWQYEADQIQVSCGGKHGLYNMAQVLLNPGDEVLIPTPFWVSYPPIVQLAGGVPVLLPLSEENDFDLDPAQLTEYATERTRAIILNSPSNPIGSIFSATALEAVARTAMDRNWIVISDDIYDTITYLDGPLPHILSVDKELRKRTLILNGVSKSFAMTGWRIGYTAGPQQIIAAMNKVQSQSTSNPSSIAQMAALAALTGPQDFPAEMCRSFLPRRDFIVKELNAIPGVSCVIPRGAFYVFPNLSAYYGRNFGDKTITGSLDLADYLLEEARIACVPGVAFGADEFIRFSFAAAMETIEEGVQRLNEALARLSP